MKEQLSESTFASVYPFFHWLIVNIPVFTALSDEAISDAKELENQPQH